MVRKHRKASSATSGNLTLYHALLTAALKDEEAKEIKVRDADQQKYLDWLTTRQHEISRILYGTRIANWRLLNAMYPNYISKPSVVYASYVNDSDQRTRLGIAGWAFIAFLLIGLAGNLNTSCLHGVYRDELAAIWLKNPTVQLKDLDTCHNGGPIHLINCTLNHLTSLDDPDPEQRSRFVLSHRYCGSKLTGYRSTDLYQNGEMTLADAMAISGAAVSTSNAGNLLYRVMLLLTNFRLGQWLRNPAHYKDEHYWPSPLRAVVSLLWNPQERPFCFVSDGGHLDNTGLSALLERRCRLMILADASDDPNYAFEDIRRVLQTGRGKYGLTFEPISVSEAFSQDNAHSGSDPVQSQQQSENSVGTLDDLVPKCLLNPDDKELRLRDRSLSDRHFVAFRVIYPEPESPDGLLILAKSSLTGDEPIDVLALKRHGEQFPHDPTSNQFLPPEQFEAYVTLGRHIGNEIISYLDTTAQALRQNPPDDGELDANPVSPLLPPSWSIPAAISNTAPDADHAPENNREDAAAEQKSDLNELKLAQKLISRDAPFDPGHLEIACGLLAAWLKGIPGTSDDDIEHLAAWTRNAVNGDCKKTLPAWRIRLANAVIAHKDRILKSETARGSFLEMLNQLGKPKRRGPVHEAIQILESVPVGTAGRTTDDT
ncbi:MAG: hypothetical protein R3C49_15705 [Planctomycetaceae bacterium]